MGCGCKEKSHKHGDVEKVELNIVGSILKIPAAIGLTILFVIISPFLLVYIWVLSVSSIFGNDTQILKSLLLRFNKNKEVEYADQEIDDGEYEIEGLEVIK